MMGAVYKLSLDIPDYPGSGSKVRRRPPNRPIPVATTIHLRLEQLAPPVESSTPASIEELLQSAFAEAPANEADGTFFMAVDDDIYARIDEDERLAEERYIAACEREAQSLLYDIE